MVSYLLPERVLHDAFCVFNSVRDLQDVIARQCRIPQDKQVLLISGGDSLDPGARVCRYASGTVSIVFKDS